MSSTMKGWEGSHLNGVVFSTNNVRSANRRQIRQMLKMTVAMMAAVTKEVVTTITRRNRSLEKRREVWTDKKRKFQTIYDSMRSSVVRKIKGEIRLFCFAERNSLV